MREGRCAALRPWPVPARSYDCRLKRVLTCLICFVPYSCWRLLIPWQDLAQKSEAAAVVLVAMAPSPHSCTP